MSAFHRLLADHNAQNFSKHAVVDLIRFAGKGISRTDSAQELGLTRTSVTIIINDLIENGIIPETESRSTRSGRPPVVLEINPRSGLVAAIDMGATHLSVALGDFCAHILDETEQPFRIADGPEPGLKLADRALMSILEENSLQIADKAVYAGNQQVAENNDSKEVILTTEASNALLE